MEDLSGLKVKEDGWVVLEEAHESLHDIFKEISRGYVPAMIANAKAISSNEDKWKTDIDGAEWEQKAFPYQAKCLKWIEGEFSSLEVKDKNRVENFLANTGCEDLVS